MHFVSTYLFVMIVDPNTSMYHQATKKIRISISHHHIKASFFLSSKIKTSEQLLHIPLQTAVKFKTATLISPHTYKDM